ncbi:hypothetical protein [Corallococcus sp. 4LFB]|uniref:hypothetical protein n=1 Tax=Corallococcus sp. 4LFB TaxID=3383249 RepID=UPI00397665DD
MSSPTTAVSSHWLHDALHWAWASGDALHPAAWDRAAHRLSMPMLKAGLSQLTSALRMTGATT